MHIQCVIICFDLQTGRQEGEVQALHLTSRYKTHFNEASLDSQEEVILMLREVQGEITDSMQNHRPRSACTADAEHNTR